MILFPKPPPKVKIKEYKPSIIWQRFRDLEIHSCEVQIENCCTGSLFPTIAHKQRRNHYRNKGQSINSHKETIFACTNCHTKIDADRELLRKTFKKLRGENE